MTRAVGIVGAGAFGTALAYRVAQAGRRVVIWSQAEAVVKEINLRHTNSDRLPGVVLPPAISATGSARELADNASLILCAVSASDIDARARVLGDQIDGHHLLVHVSGAFVEPDQRLMSEVLLQLTPALRVGVLAGPALPHDLVAGNFASMVVASDFPEVTAAVRAGVGVPPAVRVYVSEDPRGVELSAALSGAYTIAVGMADGLGVGPGARAVLITRAVAEAVRLIVCQGGLAKTFTGLAGLGNLLVRSSPALNEYSKDYQYGLALAQGAAPTTLPLTPGARSAVVGARLAQRQHVPTPVLSSIHLVITGDATPREAALVAADTVAMEE